jgi:DNA polymerase-3 subunit epsilon
MLQGRPLVFLDVETTGLGPWNSRILEIGALRLEDGKVVATCNQVLDPQEPVPPFITNLTGIHAHETAGQPSFAEMLPQLKEIFQDAVFIAHNVDFDYSFFRAEFARLGQHFAMDKLCTVRLSRALFPSERSHKLDEVIRRGGYRVANRHRAYDDAAVLHQFYHDNLQRLGASRFYELAEQLVGPGVGPRFV